MHPSKLHNGNTFSSSTAPQIGVKPNLSNPFTPPTSCPTPSKPLFPTNEVRECNNNSDLIKNNNKNIDTTAAAKLNFNNNSINNHNNNINNSILCNNNKHSSIVPSSIPKSSQPSISTEKYVKVISQLRILKLDKSVDSASQNGDSTSCLKKQRQIS